MVFTLKAISSDCRFCLPGLFCFVSLLLFFVPAHHNHFTTITFYSESFTLRLLHRRTRFRGSQDWWEYWESETQRSNFGEIWAYLFVLLSLVDVRHSPLARQAPLLFLYKLGFYTIA